MTCGGGLLGLGQWLGPWFHLYTWDVPLRLIHPDRVRIAGVIGSGLAGTLTPLALPVILAAALPAALWRGRNGVWVWAVVGGAAAAIVGSIEPAAISPGLGPAVVTLVIAGPIALVRVVSHLSAWPGSGRAGRSWVLHAVLLLQFMPLAYGLRSQIPDPRARQARAALIERLRILPGPVLVPGYGEAALQAGKADAYDPLALDLWLDSRESGPAMHATPLADSFFAPLADSVSPPWIVVGDGRTAAAPDRRLGPVLARSYHLVAGWPELTDSPAPHFVYAARMSSAPLAPAPPLAGALFAPPDTTPAR